MSLIIFHADYFFFSRQSAARIFRCYATCLLPLCDTLFAMPLLCRHYADIAMILMPRHYAIDADASLPLILR